VSAALSPAEGASLLALGRAAIEDRLLGGGVLARVRAGTALTGALGGLRACFVTLEAHDALRGCIGSTEPRHPAHEAVVRAAVAAAFDDPRFSPLTAPELPAVSLSVSALSAMTPLTTVEALVLGVHGVALQAANGGAIFLPEVAPNHGWSRDELLRQLARKAGLSDEGWREGRLYVFSSQRFSEPACDPARIRRS